MESGTVQLATRWTKLEWGAVWLFLHQRVLPLVDERYLDNSPVWGCGSLLRVGSQTFFVTAAHVFEKLLPSDFEHIGVPAGPYRSDVTTLGPGVIRRTVETATADVDVAIFPLSEEVVATKLEWDCLTTKSLAALRPVSAMNDFLIVGYPNSLVLRAQTIWFEPIPRSSKPGDTLDRLLSIRTNTAR